MHFITKYFSLKIMRSAATDVNVEVQICLEFNLASMCLANSCALIDFLSRIYNQA